MTKNVRLESISQFHEAIGYDKPRHPLITLIDYTKIEPKAHMYNAQIITGFYMISLKNIKDGKTCEMRYGRHYYDFREGSLIFMAPGQAFVSSEKDFDEGDISGWALVFHPDLIRKSHLGKKMKEYTFFSYETNEALHISDQEKQKLTEIVKTIETEFGQNIDIYSQDLMVSNIELLLNYCKRFYGRQFITRSNVNKDIVSKFEEFLTSYFDSNEPGSRGLPSVKYCAEQMGYSTNYLGDLLKKETGKNTQEHIHFYLIEKAKNLLLGTEEPVNRIAYMLGFEYPQHFSKLFKNKTGISPAGYRN